MECSYTGNFYEVHKAKKRRMIGPAQSKNITAMINDGRSSESFRETQATRLMKIGRYININIININIRTVKKLENTMLQTKYKVTN